MSLAPALEPLLTRFASELEGLFHGDLTSLAVYGPALRGQEGEIHLLIVLAQLGPAELKRLAAPLQAARKEMPQLDVLVFSARDFRRSTDVFPLRFLDIQREYQVLKGDDLVKAVFVSSEHARLACEQEIKTTLLRLRQVYLLKHGLRPAWQEALAETVRPLLRLARISLELTGKSVPPGHEALLELAQAEMGVSPEPMLRALMLQVNGDRLSHEDIAALFDGYLDNVEKLANFADALSPT